MLRCRDSVVINKNVWIERFSFHFNKLWWLTVSFNMQSITHILGASTYMNWFEMNYNVVSTLYRNMHNTWTSNIFPQEIWFFRKLRIIIVSCPVHNSVSHQNILKSSICQKYDCVLNDYKQTNFIQFN